MPEYKVVALKPLESGISVHSPSRNGASYAADETDAVLLAAASTPPFHAPQPPYCLPEPVSPHLAARRSGQEIDLKRVVEWISKNEQCALCVTPCSVTHSPAQSSSVMQRIVLYNNVAADQSLLSDCSVSVVQKDDQRNVASSRDSSCSGSTNAGARDETHSAPIMNRSITIIETAGAVFSPLNASQTNFDLALSLDPSLWILVAPDRLGVLHDLTVTLSAMKLRGRTPDFIVMSQPDPLDTSVGTNAEELRNLGIAQIDGVIAYRSEPTQSFVARIADTIRVTT